jgi:hypothetical protein
MRRLVLFALLLTSLVALNGCAADQLLRNLLGATNSDDADMIKTNPGNWPPP